MNGVIVVDKPGRMTSATVVARVKRALGAGRVGHTGTLDPMATGVLPLCIGQATKLARHLLAEDKAYRAEVTLGVDTDTLDADGRVVQTRPVADLHRGRVERVLESFRGVIEQTPPMYSAVRQDGVRLHKLARLGQVVERKSRQVRIDRLDLAVLESPRLTLEIECQKGTYVRVLAAEIGAALGCGGHLSALRRTRSGRFTLADAVPLASIEAGSRCPLVPMAEAVAHLRAVQVPPGRLQAVACGQPLSWSELPGTGPTVAGSALRLLSPAGDLVALARATGDGLSYEKVFPSTLDERAKFRHPSRP